MISDSISKQLNEAELIQACTLNLAFDLRQQTGRYSLPSQILRSRRKRFSWRRLKGFGQSPDGLSRPPNIALKNIYPCFIRVSLSCFILIKKIKGKNEITQRNGYGLGKIKCTKMHPVICTLVGFSVESL